MGKAMRILMATGLLAACSDYGISEKDGITGDSGSFPNAPIIEVSPSPLDFGPQAIGSQSVLAVEVSNQGTEALTLQGLYLHDESGVFTSTAIGDGSLDPGEFTQFVVTYSPDALQTFESRIDIYSNDPNRPTVELPLLGDVLGPKISIDPITHDFGPVGAATDVVLWVENVGQTTLTISDITYVSTSESELFLLDKGAFPDGTGSLEPAEGTELIVRFAPTDSSIEEGSVHISSDDPSNSVAVASQYGEGLPCEDSGWQGDFFAQAYDSKEIRIFPSNQDGTFASPVVLGDTLNEIISSALVVGDFSGDGFSDILAKVRPDTNSEHRLVRFSYDACTETWVDTDVLSPLLFNPIGGADLDGNGSLDVFGYSTDLMEGRTLLNDGSGNFTEQTAAFDMAAVHSGYRMAGVYHGADLNQDGHIDIALLEYSGSGSGGAGVHIFYGKGNGYFEPPSSVHTLPAPANGMDFGDFNGDGLPDLIAGLDDDGDPGQVWILLGDGSGLGAPQEVLDVAPNVESGSDDLGYGGLLLHDWNADGQADVLTGYFAGPWVDPVVDIFLGDGVGGVSSTGNVLSGSSLTGTRMAAPISF